MTTPHVRHTRCGALDALLALYAHALLQTGSRDPRAHRFHEACGFSASDKTGHVARPARS